VKSCSELFRYEDGYLASADWAIVAGAVWVEDNAAGLGAAANQAIALRLPTMDSLEQLARVRFAINNDGDIPYVGLLVRAEYDTTGSPAFVRRAYLVTISGAGNIRVFSLLMGEAAPVLLGSGTITLTTGKDNGHTLIVKVREGIHCVQEVTDILVYVDDQVSPALTVRDARTTRPEGLYVGFDIADTEGNEAVTLGEFYAHVLRSSAIRNPQPVPELKNFGDLQYELGYRLDREGDSQTNTTMRKHFINYAHAEVWREMLWKWAFRVFYFYTQAGMRRYELPAYVGLEYDVVDGTYGAQIGKITRQDMRRVDPRQQGSGAPASYTILGYGDLGGLVIEFNRTPSGQLLMELPYYAKPIPMVNDTDIPIIPPEYNEVLIWGGLRRGAMLAGLKNLYAQAAQEYMKMIADMKRADHRSVKGLTRMRSAVHLERSRVLASRGPTTQAEALGF